ncbi:MAG TPA: hypothetical protein VLY85_03165, partial [Thermoplasmata archaeon]|nr:hypothetical protein [Thermoplasmata archaeon]
MATCRDVFGFLSQVRDRHVTSTLAPADLGQLRELQIVQVLSPEEYAQIGAAANAVLADRDDLAARIAQERALAAEVATEDRKTHSILFHLEGKEKQAAALRSEAEHRASLEATDRDLAERQQKFDAEIAQRSLLDTLVPFPGGYVALTGFGARELRDLGLRLYRVSDLDFAAYWAQRQAVARELNDLADRGAQYVAGLLGPLGGVDRSALWAVSVGLAKLEPEVARGTAVYVDAYDRIGGISHNPENRLLSAEILTCLPRGVAESLPALAALDREVRQAGVPRESSLGVASMLLLGQRADGTFATTNLSEFLHYTRSYEAAALLAIVNRADVGAKFASLRSVFASWGYQPSEDVELASAFLAVSELPVEGVTTKLAILARGLGAYLQYPLVSAAIVASVPVLEA